MSGESLKSSGEAASAGVLVSPSIDPDGRGVASRALAALGEAVWSVVHPRSVVIARLMEKARSCRALNAPLYAILLEHAARDVLAGGACWQVLEGHERDSRGSALAMRFMASVHRLVLEGRAPELAPFYPSVGGRRSPDEAIGPFLRVIEHHVPELRALVDEPVQTNEVGRCAAMLGGFLLVARETGLPLRLLEIGASAGLNLRWDRYRYVGALASWGDRESRVLVDWELTGGAPDVSIAPLIVERRGCDLSPVHVGDPDARWRLMSFVLPYQSERLRVLRQALEVAARMPVPLDRASASAWLVDRLQEPVPGAATVVFHTIVMQFMSRGERQRVRHVIAQAGRRATLRAPLAWLRMEGSQPLKDVLLTTWPGGRERRIARAGLYGRPVHWLAGEEATG